MIEIYPNIYQVGGGYFFYSDKRPKYFEFSIKQDPKSFDVSMKTVSTIVLKSDGDKMVSHD